MLQLRLATKREAFHHKSSQQQQLEHTNIHTRRIRIGTGKGRTPP
jgi:hypothetical protein